MDAIQIHKIRKVSGIAGQIEYQATVQYPEEEPSTVSFVGSVCGGPVVMVTPGGQTFVNHADRFGSEFDEQWVRRFFTDEA